MQLTRKPCLVKCCAHLAAHQDLSNLRSCRPRQDCQPSARTRPPQRQPASEPVFARRVAAPNGDLCMVPHRFCKSPPDAARDHRPALGERTRRDRLPTERGRDRGPPSDRALITASWPMSSVTFAIRASSPWLNLRPSAALLPGAVERLPEPSREARGEEPAPACGCARSSRAHAAAH